MRGHDDAWRECSTRGTRAAPRTAAASRTAWLAVPRALWAHAASHPRHAIAPSTRGPFGMKARDATEPLHARARHMLPIGSGVAEALQNRSLTMATLIAGHNPKFNSKLTTLDALRLLPEPQPLGLRHHPVPHAVLVDALIGEVERRGYTTRRTQLALGANGAALFGILDLVPTQAGLLVPHEERILSLGFRNATDQSLAIQGVAGAHVMVCDNLTLSGETFAFKRKNTTGLDLGDAIATGFDRFLQHARILELPDRAALRHDAAGRASEAHHL